ncbi:Rap family tetratricopeptide repeat protein [Bacillus sp. NPDC077027]|uniref:response regulator aspartate phosphatase n=1 Tax=Bacillus sp. NPDC077027 TaxID=3390548 RepID=UPI003CFF4044
MGKLKIHSAEVANEISKWTKVISQNDLEKSTMYKDKIQNLLKNTDEDREVLLYYRLVDGRHEMLLGNIEKANQMMKSVGTLDEKADDIINFYFYFYKGQYAAYIKKYDEAISFYKIAEQRLKRVNEDLEVGTFHHKVASVYYELKQNFISINHIKKAIDTFKAHEEYTAQAIDSLILHASNCIDLFQFEEAESKYLEALEKSKRINNEVLIGKCYHNLSVLYYAKPDYQKCITYAKKGIGIQIHRENSHYYIQSLYVLANAMVHLQLSEAREQIEKGLSYSKNIQNNEYIVKFEILELMCDNSDAADVFSEKLDYIEKNKLYVELEDLSELISKYFKERDDYQNAIRFLEKKFNAQILQKKVEVIL